MTGKKANFLADNLGWILLAFLAAIIFVLALHSISKASENDIRVLWNLR